MLFCIVVCGSIRCGKNQLCGRVMQCHGASLLFLSVFLWGRTPDWVTVELSRTVASFQVSFFLSFFLQVRVHCASWKKRGMHVLCIYPRICTYVAVSGSIRCDRRKLCISFFLSWVTNKQLNLWTKWAVRTHLILCGSVLQGAEGMCHVCNMQHEQEK